MRGGRSSAQRMSVGVRSALLRMSTLLRRATPRVSLRSTHSPRAGRAARSLVPAFRLFSRAAGPVPGVNGVGLIEWLRFPMRPRADPSPVKRERGGVCAAILIDHRSALIRYVFRAISSPAGEASNAGKPVELVRSTSFRSTTHRPIHSDASISDTSIIRFFMR